jgi:hypothetical protein
MLFCKFLKTAVNGGYFITLITDGCKIKLLADRACEGDQTRKLILEKGFEPVILPQIHSKRAMEVQQGNV